MLRTSLYRHYVLTKAYTGVFGQLESLYSRKLLAYLR
jgi:hypothetical protein